MDKNKPIILCLQGPSIKQLEDNIELFRDKNVYWASLNRFSIIKKNILNKINKKLDIIYCSSKQRVQEEYQNLKQFDGILISNHDIAYNTDLKINIISDWGYGFSSLFAFLATIISLGMKRIYIFGADGEYNGGVYYKQENYKDENFVARSISIKNDTIVMNKLFTQLLKYWGINHTDQVINGYKDSAITIFPKKTIEQILKEI